jgi:hypothetical protein
MDNKEIRRGQMPPADMINEIMDLAQASTEQAGYGVIKYPGGTQHLPPDIEEIWIMVTGQGSSSSSDVSAGNTSSNFIPNSAPGSGASDPGTTSATGSGSSSSSATDAAHDNRYAWNQTMVLIDANGIENHVIDPSGLSGTQDSNPAIEVNSRTDVPEGFITRAFLSPSRNSWHFTYPGGGSTSSGQFCFEADCAAGTINVVDCNGTSSTNTSSGAGFTNSDGTFIPPPGGGGGLNADPGQGGTLGGLG